MDFLKKKRPKFLGPPPPGKDFREWIKERAEADEYWFHKIELWPGYVTPGWSDPATEKLPHFGMPKDLRGMRVLDVGCAEGFFSFEAERRGAEEVVSLDSYPGSIERFNICRDSLQSRATGYLCNVYDLSPRSFGTFDLVLFYGVLYHLRNPILALEKILSVCSGSMLLQCKVDPALEEEGLKDQVLSRFYPKGMDSGPDDDGNPLLDPTVFFVPNRNCVRAMVECAGFVKIETVSENPWVSLVLRAASPIKSKGKAPDHMLAPWS